MPEQTKIEAFAPSTPFQAELFQGYLQGMKLYWKDDLYRQVVAAAQKHASKTPPQIETAMREEQAYRLYGWLERHLQQFKYVSRYGMLSVMAEQRERLSQQLDEAEKIASERLRLSPDLSLPDYYSGSDFHQHPGGIWSDDEDAFAYEWGANAFSFAMVAADRPYRWLADYLVTRFAPKSVIDLGCGFGKLVIPLKSRDPRMTVTGVDLAAPLLRLAHRRAIEGNLEIELVQADAESTGLPAGSVDGVTCYWLLHELPQQSIRNVFREARRLTAPGGFFASFDMHSAPGGRVGEFLHIGHAARNNEPFLPGLLALDIRKELEAAGFVDAELIDVPTGAPAVPSSAALAETRTHTFTVAVGRVPA